MKVSVVIDHPEPIAYIWGQRVTIQVEDSITVKRPTRVAPVRPSFSSPLVSDEENEGKLLPSYFTLTTNSLSEAQASDGDVSSDDTEPEALTAKQINAEVSEQT